MSKQLKISGQLVQDLTEAEQAQARSNIGAASASSLSLLASTVENNTYAIAGLKSAFEGNRYIPCGAVVPSSVSGTTLIATGDIVKVSASVTNQSYMELVIEPVDTSTHTLASCVAQLTDTTNSSNSSTRILNPYAQSGSPSAYSGHIVYAPNGLGIGTIDIMAKNIEDNTFSYHKADVLWYCPNGAGVYCVNVILKENA